MANFVEEVMHHNCVLSTCVCFSFFSKWLCIIIGNNDPLKFKWTEKYSIMLYLFRPKNDFHRKIILTEKNNFLENNFRCLVLTKKLQNAQMWVWQMPLESGNVRSPLPNSDKKVWPDSAKMARFQSETSEFGRIRSYSVESWPFWPNLARIRPNPAGLAGIWSASIWCRLPNFGTGRIPVTRCCRTSAPIGFQRLTIARFWKSDIKHAYKDKEFNFKIFRKLKKNYSQTENDFL